LEHGDGQGGGDARRDEVVREGQKPLVLFGPEGKEPPERGRENIGVTQQEEEHTQGDDQLQQEGDDAFEQAPGLPRCEAGHAAHPRRDLRDHVVLRGQQGESRSQPVPEGIEPGSGAALLAELSLQRCDRLAALLEQRRDREHEGDDQEHDHQQGEHESRARGPDAMPETFLERSESDREDHGPCDLRKERRDDLVGQIGQEEHGAEEHSAGQRLSLVLAGHGRILAAPLAGAAFAREYNRPTQSLPPTARRR
jgi:hypothetical protein